MLNSAEIVRIHNEVHSDNFTFFERNPIIVSPEKRPLSVCVGDAFFGDGGKGATIAKLNTRYRQEGFDVFTLRANGGANAGHETEIDGQLIVTHQLPAGVLQEGITPVMSRGMVIHPRDLLLEIKDVASHFGGRLPSNPLVDRYAILSLDTHRALEKAVKNNFPGSEGSTNKAISQGYASFYDRTVLFVDDLLNQDWESKFRNHYQFINKGLSGFGEGYRLENARVSAYDDPDGNVHQVGTEDEFIKRLCKERKDLRHYVPDNMYRLITSAWDNHQTAFTIEFGQGTGLDPWFGVYPDVTASRTISRNLPDSTYGIVEPEDIAVRGAVMKTIYLSSVGSRKLPEILGDQESLAMIQKEQREYGKTTGRPRPPKHISLPLLQAGMRFSGDEYLLPTHLDAARKDTPIHIIYRYIDDKTGEEKPYLPFQKEMNGLRPEALVFQGWDGAMVKEAEHPRDLPDNLQRLLAFYSRTTRKIAFGTYGPGLTDYISWMPDTVFPRKKY